MRLLGADLNQSVCSDVTWKADGDSRHMDPREVEDAVARDVLGWTFVSKDEVDSSIPGPGWYKGDRFVGWPDQWATDMDSAWRLAAELAKDGLDWQLRTKKEQRIGSFVKITYPSHETVEAEAGPDQMPLAMCLALLKMIDAKKAKTADGLKTV